jgi:VWFA-related protein
MISVLLCGVSLTAQHQAGDTVRLRTREVHIEVLVKNKRTGAPIKDLSREDFEVLDDGKPRRLSYFSRDAGAVRRPLAIILVLDLRPGGAGRYLRRLDILMSLAAALADLPPEDEVAVMATWVGGVGDKVEILTDFTRDRTKILAALKAVPSLVGREAIKASESLDISIPEVARLVTLKRPDSQAVMVYISDAFTTLLNSERDSHAMTLTRANVIFNPLICSMQKKVAAGVWALKPLAILGGVSMDAVQHLARHTGGEVVYVHKPDEYGAGLEKVLGNLTARYSLGFELDEREPDDGRMHKLEVRVKARNSSGKERRLEVFARRGYYLPQVKETASQKETSSKQNPAAP